MGRERGIRLAVHAACLLLLFSGWLGAGPAPAEETLEQRRKRVESMDPAHKAELRRAQDQFAALGEDERRRLQDLHDKIESDRRSQDLQRVMGRYCEWLNTVTPSDRAKLRRLPPEERIEEIRRLREEQSRRRRMGPGRMRGLFWGDRLGRIPSPKDGEVLRNWIDGYMDRGAPELIDGLSQTDRDHLRQELAQAKDDPERRGELFAEVWVRWQLANPKKVPPLAKSDLTTLRSEFSPPAQEMLKQMGPDDQARLITVWIRALVFYRYMGRSSGPPQSVVSDEELKEYFENELPPEERGRLGGRMAGLPPEQMRRLLWLNYFLSKSPDMPDLGPGHPGLRGRRGPPRGNPLDSMLGPKSRQGPSPPGANRTPRPPGKREPQQ